MARINDSEWIVMTDPVLAVSSMDPRVPKRHRLPSG